MSIWTDHDESDLLSKVRAVHTQAEPEAKDFFGLPDPNWWRTLGVMQQQQPATQVADKWTKEGRLQEHIEKAEKESTSRDKAKQEFEKGWLGTIFRYLPTSSQAAAILSFQKGDVPQGIFHLERAAREALKTASQSEAAQIRLLKQELADIKKELDDARNKRTAAHPSASEPKKPAEKKKKNKRGKGGKCANQEWVDHYKTVRAGNVNLKHAEILKLAKETYKRN